MAGIYPYDLPTAWLNAGYVEQFSAQADASGAISQSAFAEVDGYRVGNWVFIAVSPLVAPSSAVASAPISLSSVLPTDYLPQLGMVMPAVVVDSKSAGGTMGLNADGSMAIMPYSGAFTASTSAGLVSSVWFAYLLQPPPAPAPVVEELLSITVPPHKEILPEAVVSDLEYEKV